MLLDSTAFSGVVSNNIQVVNFSAELGPKLFKTLSDSLYQNKIGSIVRELSCNAFDAHREAKKGDDVPFEIHLPSMFEPYFSVKDYGIGMDHKTIEKVFVVLFASTKDFNNDNVGAFGLGCKTPFSYTDSFTVIAIKDGISRTYSMFKQEDGMPSCALLSESNTDSGNGVEVIIPVNDVSDRRSFNQEVVSQLHFFPVRPKITGGDYDTRWIDEPLQSDLTMEMNGIKFYNTYHPRQACVIMGPVGYDLNYGILLNALPKHKNLIEWMRNKVLRICFDIGEISVTPSRETLSYDKKTFEAFDKKFDGLLESLTQKFRDTFEAKSSYLEKICYLNTNKDWAGSLVKDYLDETFKDTIFTKEYNAYRINLLKVAEVSKLGNNIYFTKLSNIIKKNRYDSGNVAEYVVSNNLKIIVMNTHHKVKRRVQTVINNGENGVAFYVNHSPLLNEAEVNNLYKVYTDIFTSNGISVAFISDYAPAEIVRGTYSFVKSHGYKLNEDCNNPNANFNTLKHGPWNKITDKGEIEPGFYVKSNYGDVTEDSCTVLQKYFQHVMLGLIPKTDMEDIYAFPLKTCEKLANDDNWVSLEEFMKQFGSLKLDEYCHDVWVSSVIVEAYNKFDGSKSKTFKSLETVAPLLGSVEQIEYFVVDHQILLDSYDDEIRKNMLSIRPDSYNFVNKIHGLFCHFLKKKFENISLVDTDYFFNYAYFEDPKLIRQIKEYIEFISEKFPERFDNTNLNTEFILNLFPKIVVDIVAPVAYDESVEEIKPIEEEY